MINFEHRRNGEFELRYLRSKHRETNTFAVSGLISVPAVTIFYCNKSNVSSSQNTHNIQEKNDTMRFFAKDYGTPIYRSEHGNSTVKNCFRARRANRVYAPSGKPQSHDPRLTHSLDRSTDRSAEQLLPGPSHARVTVNRVIF